MNSAALQLAGITRDTKIIGRTSFPKDDSGQPNGTLTGDSGTVMRLTMQVAPPSLEERTNLVLAVQRRQLALGLTGVRDLQLDPEGMRTYYEMWRSKRLLMRISMGLQVKKYDPAVSLDSMIILNLRAADYTRQQMRQASEWGIVVAASIAN